MPDKKQFRVLTGIIATMLATGLLMSPTLLAAADDDTDLKTDKDDKCDNKHKYEGTCDHVRPVLTVTTSKHIKEICSGQDCTVAPIVIQGTATDAGSGIKQVQVCINKPNNCTIVSNSSGAWTFDTPSLGKGGHDVTIKAYDKVNNIARANVLIDIQQRIYSGADLSGDDLSGDNLSKINLSNSNLSGTNLQNAVLKGTNLSNSDLSGVDFTNADLSGANLSNADLSNATLSGAILKGTNLHGAITIGCTGCP